MFEPKASLSAKPHHSLRQALTTLELVMAGFSVGKDVVDEALEDISHAVRDSMLPLYEFQEALSPIGGRIDQTLLHDLQVR